MEHHVDLDEWKDLLGSWEALGAVLQYDGNDQQGDVDIAPLREVISDTDLDTAHIVMSMYDYDIAQMNWRENLSAFQVRPRMCPQNVGKCGDVIDGGIYDLDGSMYGSPHDSLAHVSMIRPSHKHGSMLFLNVLCVALKAGTQRWLRLTRHVLCQLGVPRGV